MAAAQQVGTVAVVGAGKLGTTLARRLVRAGVRTLISGRSDPALLGLVVDTIAPGAEPASVADAVPLADVVVLALPLHRVPELPRVLAGRLTVDATNYWAPTDGPLPGFVDPALSLSESVARVLGADRLVKSFNHLGYHDLDLAPVAAPLDARVAIGVAGDDATDRATVAGLVDRLGFAPVELASLRAGRGLEAGHGVFGSPMSAAELGASLAREQDAPVREAS